MSTNRLVFQKQSATFRRLPSEARIEHGPPALLGRAILKADQAARRRGVYLSLVSCHELFSADDAGDDRDALASAFDPAQAGNTSHDSFAIIGHNLDGDVVATQAARLFDWRTTDLGAEAEGLRLFHAAPALARSRGERCVVTAAQARAIRGRVVYAGAEWYRPDYRGRTLSAILPRVARMLAYTRWQHDITFGMVADTTHRAGYSAQAGYAAAAAGISLIGAAAGPGPVHFNLVWMDERQLLGDLEWFVARFDAASEPAIGGYADRRRRASI